eukprot:COSAG04_NODE_3972_length_2387_cov_32.962413_2_plen_62_part_00
MRRLQRSVLTKTTNPQNSEEKIFNVWAWLAHGEIEGGHVRVGGRELLEDSRQRRVRLRVQP